MGATRAFLSEGMHRNIDSQHPVLREADTAEASAQVEHGAIVRKHEAPEGLDPVVPGRGDQPLEQRPSNSLALERVNDSDCKFGDLRRFLKPDVP